MRKIDLTMKMFSLYKVAAILIVAVLALFVSCKKEKNEDEVILMYGCPEEYIDTTSGD